jgi:dsDNA-specific endonuclease/ATPase MutS2
MAEQKAKFGYRLLAGRHGYKHWKTHEHKWAISKRNGVEDQDVFFVKDPKEVASLVVEGRVRPLDYEKQMEQAEVDKAENIKKLKQEAEKLKKEAEEAKAELQELKNQQDQTK